MEKAAAVEEKAEDVSEEMAVEEKEDEEWQNRKNVDEAVRL